jgi:hypothetical protein
MPRIITEAYHAFTSMIVVLALGLLTVSAVYFLAAFIFTATVVEEALSMDGAEAFFVMVLAMLVLGLCYYPITRKLSISRKAG